jgi:hypothetical protein
MAPVLELIERENTMTPPNRTETEKRLKRLEELLARTEKAINGLAYFAAPHTGMKDGPCPELDEIRRELAGSIIPGGQERDIRPLAPLPEQRAKVVA